MSEKVKDELVGKTIEAVEFANYRAPHDTITLHFTDKTSIKIMCDPDCVFDGLVFYTKRFKTVEEYVEIK